MQDFLSYMKKATVAVTTVAETKKRYLEHGWKEISFHEDWDLKKGENYFVQTSPSMLMAFQIPEGEIKALHIIGAHTDNPGLKIKPNPELFTEGVLRLNIEVYGGPIFYTWFDRPLSFAGTVALRSDNPLQPEIRIVDMQRPLLSIPSLAIHMNREVNKGIEIKAQKEMLPFLATWKKEMEKGKFLLLLAEELKVKQEDILDFDLIVYCAEEGCLLGEKNEMLSCPRLDDTAMVYATMQAMMESKAKSGINIALFVDHEEIGSLSRQGADSMIFTILLDSIRHSLEIEKRRWQQILLRSFFLSADAAHAAHPGYPEKCDPTNRPKLNQGIVIKCSANKAYASESLSVAALQQLCDIAKVPYQKFVNHSDIRGGTTIGSIISRYLPVPIVDLGLPMLAMHSAREFVGKQDMMDMIGLMKVFYQL